jgi:signal transduction histidine kinase
MIKRMLVFIFFLLTVNCFAQAEWIKKKDSIAQSFFKMKDDTNKVLALMKYGQWCETYSMDSASACYIKMNALSQKINYISGVLKYYANYTFILNQQGKFEESLKLNLESVDLAHRKGSKEQIAICLFNTGSSYNNMTKYDSAITYYLQAVKIFEELNLAFNTAVAYDNIGGIFSNIGQYEKGLEYHLKAFDKAKKVGDSTEIASAALNTGVQYSKLNKLKEAEQYLNTTLSIAKKIKSTYLLIQANLALAEVFLKENHTSKSISYAKLGLETAHSINSKYSEIEALKILTRAYYLKKDMNAAIKCGEQAIALGKENNALLDIFKVYNIVSSAYAETGNYKAGYDNLMIAKNLEDSLNGKELTKEIEQLELNYQAEKKEKQILQLQQIEKKQQILIGGLALSIAFILLTSFLVYKNYQQKRKLLLANTTLQQQKINELEIEKQLLATQSILQGQEDERKRLAKDLHDGLGSILSSAKFSFNNLKSDLTPSPKNAAAFERSIAMLDQSIQELRRVAHNMMPETLVKFGLNTALQDFCNSINHANGVQITYQSFDLNDDFIPPNKSSAIYRIVQELVNNILKHANAKTALVQLVKKDNALSITVEDDGNGFDKAILQTNSGMGYLNLQNRVAYIHGKIDIQTNVNKGTSVNIEIANIAND